MFPQAGPLKNAERAPHGGPIGQCLEKDRLRLNGEVGGSVVLWFTLTLLPMMIALGSALDYSRATTLRSKLQVATDTTVLLLAQEVFTRTDDQLLAMARAAFAASNVDGTAQVDRIEVGMGRSEVKLYASASYKTAFMQLAGIDNVALASFAKTVVQSRPPAPDKGRGR